MNRRPLFVSSVPLCALALLQAQMLPAQLRAPQAGIVRYSDGTVHAVSGLPANYIVDGQVLAKADTISFSDRGGLLAQNGRITLVDASFKTLAEYDSSESTPILNIDGPLSSAVAWLPSQQALLYWNGSALTLVSVNGGGVLGAVSSVWLADQKTAKLLATNFDRSLAEATVSLESGELTSLEALPVAGAAPFHQQTFLLTQQANSLEIATASAIVHTFPITATGLTFERMSSNAVHVLSPGTNENWVLHLGTGTATQLSLLPASGKVLTAQEVQK